MHRSLIIILYGLLACAPLQAQQSSTASKTVADPLAPVRGWIGQWQCRGTAFAPGGTQAHTYTYRMKVAPALRRRWLQFTVILTPTGVRVPVLEGQDFWGQDPASGALIEVFLDSRGGYGRGVIDILTATRVHYRGEGAGDAEERYYDVTFEREPSGQLLINYQASLDGQTWWRRTEDRCTRVIGRR